MTESACPHMSLSLLNGYFVRTRIQKLSVYLKGHIVNAQILPCWSLCCDGAYISGSRVPSPMIVEYSTAIALADHYRPKNCGRNSLLTAGTAILESARQYRIVRG